MVNVNRTHVLLFIFAFLAIAYACLEYQNFTWRPLDPDELAATILNEPHSVRPFHLAASDGREISKKEFEGHWSLVFFGFTHCGYICPTTMTMLDRSIDVMLHKKLKTLPVVWLISIDPDRDDSVAINNYLKKFNHHFNGATGSREQLDRLTHDMMVVYQKESSTEENGFAYNMQHSSIVLLLNPKAQVHALFTMPIEPEELANDFKLISQHYYDA